MAMMFGDGGEELTAKGARMVGEERQQGVGGGAGEDLDAASIGVTTPRTQEVASDLLPGGLDPVETVAVESGDVEPGGLEHMALFLLAREVLHADEVGIEPVPEDGIGEHGGEGGGDGEGEAPWDGIACPAVEHLEEWEVTLDDGFEEPAFLQEFGVFGMPDEGEVGVEDEGDGGDDPVGTGRRRGAGDGSGKRAHLGRPRRWRSNQSAMRATSFSRPGQPWVWPGLRMSSTGALTPTSRALATKSSA